MTETPKTLSEVVGTNARKLRIARDATQDQLAMAARAYGLKWSTSRVAELEAGRLAIGVPVLIGLAQAIGDLGEDRVTLANLLQSQGWIELGKGFAISAGSLSTIFGGATVDLKAGDLFGWVDRYKAIVEVFNVAANPKSGILRMFSFPVPDDEMEQALRLQMGLAEARAAKSLGLVPNYLVNVLALRTWGRSLSEERDARLGQNPSPQDKGHISRGLIAELRKAKEEAVSQDGDGLSALLSRLRPVSDLDPARLAAFFEVGSDEGLESSDRGASDG